jgi:hypothetical protein
VGSRGARHRCRCSRARGFRHRDPASGAPSPAELGPRTRREHESQRARPRICRSGTRRRSSTSATNSTREHDRGTARSPPRVRKNEAHVRLRAPLTPLSGVGSATKRAEALSLLCRRGARRAVRPKPRRPTKVPAPSTGSTVCCLWSSARGRRPSATTAASRGFTGQGPTACAAGASLVRSAFRQTEDEGATPTRSARTPLVARPWHRRLERPAIARQGSQGACPLRSHHVSPCPREG